MTVAQVLDVARSKREGKACWKPPKGRRARTIKLPRFLVDILRKHVEGKDGDALVFPSLNGTPIINRNFRRDVLRPASARARFTFEVNPHALRHTAASILIADRATPGAVRAYLGHKKTSTTMDIYVGLFKSEGRKVAKRLDSTRARAQENAAKKARKKAAKKARKRAAEAHHVDGVWMETPAA
ncbi:tyrosine-type recombinase/integrase [Demequina rhizosphaerae]|uniref:tyrosine-type recombinase/integrase n=1 Tax=Demequina rhizosphaerae TaxID=1638985 RepID=UPI00155A7103|nr:tyrosine-type recombinase/integrase [Demequina rhizosphaerae]